MDSEMQDKIGYRQVEENDLELLFFWANDPLVRKNSFHSEAITYEEHVKWFQRRMLDDEDKLYIFLVNDIPAGQFRLSYDKAEVVIGYSLSSKYRGRGLGVEMIKQALQIIKQEKHDMVTVIGRVKKENEASKKVFEKLGFTMTQKDDEIVYKMNVS